MNKTKRTQPQTPYTPQGRDLFQTPCYATRLLLPYIPDDVVDIWEPAAGEGKISEVLEKRSYHVFKSDLRDCPEKGIKSYNFLSESNVAMLCLADAVITNPPFSLKEKFYKKCRELGIPFALLIPADYAMWTIRAVNDDGCVKVIPTRRIDYITPTGLSGASGHTSNFHSLWLTWGFIPYQKHLTEMYVDLTNEQKKDI